MKSKLDSVHGIRNLDGETDLATIGSHISRYSPQAATALMVRISQAVRQLQDFPLSGRPVPEEGLHELRELISSRYRIIYLYAEQADRVSIVSVRHGARSLGIRDDPRDRSAEP